MAELLLTPRYVTINHEDTMLVTNRQGWINGGRTGLYSRDTRYLSSYRLTLNGFEPRFLGVSRPFYFTTTFYYTNPPIGTQPHLIPENSLLIQVGRYVRGGVHEDISLTNYTGKPVQLSIVLNIDVDFVDIFQVRGLERVLPRLAESHWDVASSTLTARYRKGDFTRALRYQLHDATRPASHSLGALTIPLMLAHGETWRTCVSIHFEDKPAPDHVESYRLQDVHGELQRWQETTAGLETPNLQISRAYDQAVMDVASLRLTEVDGRWFPAAGVPWFVALFGRDSLITALQTTTVYPPFALGVLARLSQLQGKKVDVWTEEEPGKIPHELRRGELAATGRVPFTPYYGTVDASLLYVILLHELYRFTADRELLERFYAPAVACLEWARVYGDVDADDFVEYHLHSSQSYRNQGWKDASDAVVYPDGSLVEPPIAICEVQGYYYDALRRMAEIAQICARQQESTAYARRAETLFERFNTTFWLEDEGTYAFGLDPHKRPIRTMASNAGQLLWSGIVPRDRASRVAGRLLSDDMFSGWGIRTLSAANPAYDPVSYQRGSVWPHDNGIIALGLKRYGLWREANRVAEGIFAAAACYERHSLPEVFAGVDRAEGELPVPYYDTNLPQAWAAGSVFMLLRAVLGLEPDPARRRLVVSPTLPEWLPDLTLRNLTVFDGKLDLRFRGVGSTSTVEVVRREGAVEVDRVGPGPSPILDWPTHRSGKP